MQNKPVPKNYVTAGKKDECPLQGKCLTDNVVYRAIVKTKDEPNTEDYVGITGNPFKTRFNQHNCDFKPEHTKKTTLSQYVSNLQEKKTDFNIFWSILKRASTFSPSTGRCNLCIAEKYIFLHKDDLGSLNKRDELLANCLHMQGLLVDKT